MLIIKQTFFLISFLAFTLNASSQFLKRSISSVPQAKAEFSTRDAWYKPVFGAGDNASDIIAGASRYGLLVLEPGGRCNKMQHAREEQVLFVLEGTGLLICGKEIIPVRKNDFMHIPEGARFGFSNPREQPLSVIVMGFNLMPPDCAGMKSKFGIANTDEVEFQILPSHGPTTQFQLLMGTTESTRDRLATACQVTSLFIMDFAAGGTNNPHRHDNEEEIYLILRGHGDIVAGETADGEELRHPSREGDVYFFAPKTLIGFYSGNSPEEQHAQILAVRFKYPSLKQNQ